METSSSNRMTRTQRACGLGTMSCSPSVNHKTARQTHTHTLTRTYVYTLYKTHAHTHAEVHTLFLFLKHYTPKNVSAHTCTFVVAGCGGVLVGQHKTPAQSLSFYQVQEKQGEGRGWHKIYLLLSENFDPGVVNLSKESSQLTRKHEEERRRGEAGMFGVVVVVGGGTSITPTNSKELFFRTWNRGGWGCSDCIYNFETDPLDLQTHLQLKLTPFIPRETPLPLQKKKKKKKIKTNITWEELFGFICVLNKFLL